MKYVVMQDENGVEEIFIFPKSIHHDVFADSISRLKDQSHGNWKRVNRVAIAAGFILYNYDGMTCHGHSETLKLKSRGFDDEALI